MKRVGDNEYVLSDGQVLNVWAGVIGLDDQGSITGGYDEHACESVALTPELEDEIADYMIEKWTNFKEKTK